MTDTLRRDALDADPALPGLASLFDPERVRAALAAAALEPGASPPLAVRLDYLRWKPEESAIASGLAVFPHGDVRFSLRLLRSERRRSAADADPPPPLPLSLPPSLSPFAVIEELGATLFRYPLDPSLRALRHAAEIDEMKRAATAAWHARGDRSVRFRALDARVEPVRYKAGRRAVLRASLKWKRGGDDVSAKGRTVFYARVCAEPAEARFSRNIAFHRAAAAVLVRTPEPLGAAPEIGALLEESILATAASAPSPREFGAAAGRLHGGPPPSGTAIRIVDERALDSTAAAAIAAAFPALAARARSVATAIARLRGGASPADARPSLLHGDLAIDQAVLGDDGRVALLDLDRVAIGPAAVDVGEAIARFLVAGVTGATRSGAAVDAFLAGYAETASLPSRRAIDARVAASLLRLVVSPLRAFRPLFRAEAESILAAAEAAVS